MQLHFIFHNIILLSQVVALNTELSDIKKSKEELEEAKKTAEDTIESERQVHSEKVQKVRNLKVNIFQPYINVVQDCKGEQRLTDR